MKTLHNFILITAIGLFTLSCSKDKDNSHNLNSDDTSFGDIEVSPTFNWSSSVKGQIEVIVEAPAYLHTANQPVELQDEEGTVLDIQFIQNGSVSFYLSKPQASGKVYAHYPNTGEKLEIASNHAKLKLKDILAEGLNSTLLQKAKKGGNVKKGTQGTNMVNGGDFENISLLLDTSAYSKLRVLGSWYAQDNNGTITSNGGSNIFKSKSAGKLANILQSFSVDGDEIFDFSYEYSGNGGFFVLFFDAAKSFIGYTTVYTNGSQGFTNFLTSSTVKYIQIYGFCDSNGYLDNVALTEVVEPDDDNDGVPNRKDAYPNDPTRAYATFFPTMGGQTLAFEDLWPAAGDYDFNDLVISNRVEFRKNANHDLVDAVVTVKVLGLGAGLSSGLALHLVKSNKQPFTSNIISGVSGGNAQIDPDVTNGIIVFNDDRKALKPFYNNNGIGPDGAPQEFQFTITFNTNANEYVLPDFYIYRTGSRGRETHLSGFSGTSAADVSLYNSHQDVNGTYKTARGLPWVVEVVYPSSEYFHHPKEKVDMGEAYPKFKAWAISNGTRYVGWMLLGDKNKVYYIKH